MGLSLQKMISRSARDVNRFSPVPRRDASPYAGRTYRGEPRDRMGPGARFAYPDIIFFTSPRRECTARSDMNFRR